MVQGAFFVGLPALVTRCSNRNTRILAADSDNPGSLTSAAGGTVVYPCFETPASSQTSPSRCK